MIDNKNEMVIKHREDVIDTLQLRAKERRVLYTLIVVLLLTVAYENSSWLFSGFMGNDVAVPELGQRRKITVKAQNFSHLEKLVAGLIEEYPQFWSHLQRQQQNLAQCIALTAEATAHQTVLAKTQELLNNLHEFASLPVIQRSKKLEELSKELKQISRMLNLPLNTDFAIKPIVFRAVGDVSGNSARNNLFEFNR